MKCDDTYLLVVVKVILDCGLYHDIYYMRKEGDQYDDCKSF